MAINDRPIIIGANFSHAWGSIGKENLTRPYAPSFSRIAASTTEPPVGASVWASGSQVCTGHIGTLTAKANRKPKKSSTCVLSGSGSVCQSLMAKLPPALL
jgi:hypothetical protein